MRIIAFGSCTAAWIHRAWGKNGKTGADGHLSRFSFPVLAGGVSQDDWENAHRLYRLSAQIAGRRNRLPHQVCKLGAPFRKEM
jgi:hypothetical protein